MKIIFIHGMNQQNYDEKTLKQHWLNVFKTGLNHAEQNIELESLDIKLPFYGDLLTKHQLNNSLDLNTLLPKSLLQLHLPFHLWHNTSIVEEHSPCITPLPCFNPEQSESLTQRLSVITALTKDHIIVAHSLGTVIAYNLLHQFAHFRVHRFITLGSPLAFKVIQEKLTLPISRPPQLHGDWFNFYSPDDFLTAFPLSEAPFNFEPPIINQAITTLVDKPHQITGYLEHPAVIQSIVDALKLKKQPL
ncbi:hypothetical protein [Acinetobacter sp. ANC 4173]|uniref:hypothetical protein n=1 Tax=Acinetobacter sp. ANC 4173 TaxID=2529837 RepID=UPI00103C1654|nr:hypothetical protein [Acinetobacter sp. ANC 4173]TCB75139.1 hypothetical protein E0H94_16860 [Acinetobacter sp. ANC 4173]